MQEIDETSEELREALGNTLALTFGTSEPILVDSLNTGGGVIVCAIDLSQDGRFMGRQVWLTRESDEEWLLGFYDFAMDEEDEGVCVTLRCGPYADDPLWIAGRVAAILSRLHVTELER